MFGDPVELRERDHEPDQDDHRVDEAADEAQAGGGLARDAAPCRRPRGRPCRGRRGRRWWRSRPRCTSVTPALIQVAVDASIGREHGQGHSARRPRNLDRVRESGPASAIRVAAPRLSRSRSRRPSAAIRAEITYYRAHLHEGRDAASLHDLRVRCAEAMGLDGVPTRDGARRAARRPALLRLPRQRADAARAARAGHPARRRLQLGLLAARAPGRDGPHAALDGALASAEVGCGQAGRRDLPRGAASSPARRRSRPGTSATRPRPTWRAPARPAFTPVLIAREGDPPAAARSVRSPNSYPWPQLDRREQRVPRLARTRGAVDARPTSRSPPTAGPADPGVGAVPGAGRRAVRRRC